MSDETQDDAEETQQLFDVFTIGENTFPNNMREHLDLQSKHIQDSFMEHPDLYSWYATAYELALDVELRLKAELDRTYAHCDANARQQAQAAGIKMTEKKVENVVITDDLYKQVQGEYLTAKRNTGLLRAGKDAMIHRRDMLIQMGANYRAEGNSDITLKQQQALTRK